MSKYICRDEACQRMHEAGGCDAVEEWAKGYDDGITEAIRIINEMPAVDVAPIVQGRWDCGDDMFEYAICSACKWDSGEAWEYAKKNFKFCPHRGAKMDESEGEQVNTAIYPRKCDRCNQPVYFAFTVPRVDGKIQLISGGSNPPERIMLCEQCKIALYHFIFDYCKNITAESEGEQ